MTYLKVRWYVFKTLPQCQHHFGPPSRNIYRNFTASLWDSTTQQYLSLNLCSMVRKPYAMSLPWNPSISQDADSISPSRSKISRLLSSPTRCFVMEIVALSLLKFSILDFGSGGFKSVSLSRAKLHYQKYLLRPCLELMPLAGLRRPFYSKFGTRAMAPLGWWFDVPKWWATFLGWS